MRAVTCVPWRGGDADREAAWDRLRPVWQSSGLPLYVADSDPALSFNVSQARNRAAAAAGDWEVAAFIDADTWIDPAALGRAMVEAADADAITLPFTRFWSCGPGDVLPVQPEMYNAGGVMVIPRPVWEIVGGFDERFTRWGAEDSALLWAAATMTGRLLQLDGDAIAAYHPRPAGAWAPDPGWVDLSQDPDAPAGYTANGPRPMPPLALRYRAAIGDQAAMRAILNERTAA